MARQGDLKRDPSPINDAESRLSWGVTGRLAVSISLAAVYVAAGKIGLHYAMVHPNATAIWAPTGISLSACLLFGSWVWPAIFAGAFLVNVTTAGSIATSIAIAFGNTLEAVLGCYFIERYANGRKVFDRSRDAFKFLALTAAVSTTVSATIGVSSLCLGGYADWSRYLWIWLTWWLGDASSDLIVAPLLILWATNPRIDWSRAQKREAVLLFLAMLITGIVVFGGWLRLGTQPYPPYPPGYFCFPILVWAAFRFGPRESATTAFALSVIAIVGTLRGLGPFAHGTPNISLLLLQNFLGLAGLISAAAASAISERRRLDETRSELAAIVDGSMEAIVGMTLDGRITSWNESASRIFGFSAEEAVGKSISVITPVEKVVEQQEVVAGLARGTSIRHFETVRMRKNGELIDVLLTVSPIKDRDGRIVGASMIVRDISGEKLARRQREELLNSEQAARGQAEKALSMLRRLQMVTDIALPQLTLQQLMTALLNRLRSALDADAAQILLVDPDGRYLLPTSSVGLREELRRAEVKLPIGRGIAGTIAVSPEGLIFEDLSRVEAITPFLPMQLSSLVGAPLKVGGRVIGVIHAGTQKPHKFTVDDLNLIHLVADRAASAIERTRLHETQQVAREAAEAANRTKDEFLTMLGHELRNPLHAILLAVRLLENRATTVDADARARLIISRQTEHVARLIDDLLDVSRVTSGRIALLRRPTNFGDCLSECVAALRETHQLDDHKLETEIQPAWVDADSDRLIQIVTNLLSNALKYTPPGGMIRTSVYAENEDAVLRVEDNGIGIPAIFLPRAFDLFARGEASLDFDPGGLGVGLTLVRRLVELHGGTVEALSDGINHGSTFIVRLPRIPTPMADAGSRVVAAKQAGIRRRILIVEDNTDARESLRDLLKLSGHEVYEAADGQAAVSAALTLRPEVALIDIGLPGFDGHEVARRIRTSAVCDDTVLIALTGYGQREDRQRAERAGFRHHLVKPVDLHQLTQLIAALPNAASSNPNNPRVAESK
jgi:PAS domain S-box-containing protein